ncbi:MAG: DNA helicase, partial [Desulfobulbaceae bacterium]|nr:DNA helicase [Desulfobulbaceae bacterium]
MTDAVTQFYLDQLPEAELKNNILQTSCPFCEEKSGESPATLIVFLNQESYFHGYFRCMNRCTGGGFPLHFARLRGVSLRLAPGFDPDRDYSATQVDYPVKNINAEVLDFMDKLTDELITDFAQTGISREVLTEMQIGYNGRYLVYPYVQADGNCYSAHCVHPDRAEDTFWYGDVTFFADRFKIFNSEDIDRCENGSLILVEGERNLLTLKELGLPVAGIPTAADLAHLDVRRFSWLRTLFIWVSHNVEAEGAARAFATRLGYKVRLIRWSETTPKNYTLTQLAADKGKDFRQAAFTMINEATSFSPFTSPEGEYLRFTENLDLEAGDSYHAMQSGFPLLDRSLGGIHGINIMGGTPKAGNSCFFIQIASQMAERKIPVIYYDFEN